MEPADQPGDAAFAHDENLDPLEPDDPTSHSAIAIASAFLESGGRISARGHSRRLVPSDDALDRVNAVAREGRLVGGLVAARTS
ncbi:hypothetical protein [Nonomuraea sp. NPDC049480]|uniref:hypothetical protein n=1 Tax=Nonomuraea sp. NPDC049480 TaxID=3364353 RepID=UPI0037A374A8